MNANHIVGIWVCGAPGVTESFSTGYLVAPNRVLTVSHVLMPGYKKVLVWFVYYDRKPVEATVLWDGRENDPDGLDALVLECQFSGDRPSTVSFLEEPPTVLSQWQSNCFPEFARNGGPPEKDGYFGAHGEFNSPPTNVLSFPISCMERRPIPVSWGGASGGPIFVGSRLAGIIHGISLGKKSTDDNGNPIAPFEQLIAVPAWQMVAVLEFRASLSGVDSRVFEESEIAWRRRLATRIQIELNGIKDPFVIELFRAHFDRPLPKNQVDQDNFCQQLVNEPSLVAIISAMGDECRRKGLQDSAEQLEEVENHLLPRLFSPEERKRFWDELHFQGAILVEHAVTSPAAAALRMASNDGRRLSLAPPEPATPIAEWQEPNMFRLGQVRPGELSPKHIALRILLELAGQRLGAEQLSVSQQARAEILTGSVRKEELDLHLDGAIKDAKTLENTVRIRKRTHGTPYCVLRVTDTCPRETLKSALVVLREWLPSLHFLEITHNAPYREHEAPMLELLRSRTKER